MAILRSNELYDTARDPGEEGVHRGNRPGPASDRDSAGRWEDDGGAPLAAAPTDAGGPAGKKPAWSVRSLRDLLEAVRLSKRPETAAAIREREDANRARALHAKADRMAEANRIERDRYRNAWEQS